MGDQKSSNTAIVTIADVQQHCIAVIKQEVEDEDETETQVEQRVEKLSRLEAQLIESLDDDNIVSRIAHESGIPATTTSTSTSVSNKMTSSHRSGNDFEQQYRLQQEEIASRLHYAVTEKIKQINNNKLNSFGNGGDRTNCSNTNLNNSNSSNSRLTVRSLNNKNVSNNHQQHNNNSTADLKMYRNVNSSKNDDLISNLLDNDDINNNSSNHSGAGLDEDNGDNNNSNYLLPCPLCEIPLEPRVFRQHLDRHYPRDSPICPVLQCGRRFAHPNSVRNHMRLKHTLQWAKMKAMRSSGGPFSGIPY